MRRLKPENAEKAILAARYKLRRSAEAAMQHRWWRYVDIERYVVQPDVLAPGLWCIVQDFDGAIRQREAKLIELAKTMRDEKKGPSRKSQRRVDRMFILNLNKTKPKAQ